MPIVTVLQNPMVAPKSTDLSISMLVRLLLATIILSASLPAASHAQWYGSADFLVPTRNVSSDNVFARNQVIETSGGMPTGNILVGTDSRLSLDFGFAAAGRFTVGNRPGEFGFEATYLTTDEFTTQGEVFDPGSVTASPFGVVGALAGTGLDYNHQVNADYTSELQSIELSLTQLVYAGSNGEATFLYGVRAFAIDEAFRWEGMNTGGTNTVDSLRKNRMIGPQIGLNAWTPVPGGRLSLNLAGAYAYNEVEASEIYAGLGFSGGGPRAGTQREASLVGELGIEYLLQMTPNAGLRVGFEVLGLSDVGLATNVSALSNRLTDKVVYTQPYFGFLFIH
ncbi:MAG: hypothetical protein ABI614_09480 [Planctomycetota bacterium]